MKKVFLTLMAVLAFAGLRAQDVNVEVSPINESTLEQEGFNVFFLNSMNFGFVSPISQPDGMGAKHFGSYELGINVFELSYTPVVGQNVSFAMGLADRFFKTRHKSIINNDSGYYFLEPFPAEAYGNRKRKSRLDVYSLNATVGYKFKVSDQLNIGLDVIGNYNFGAKSVSKYKIGGDKKKVTHRHFKTQQFTPEYRITFGFEDLDFYVKFAPHSLFQKEYGPKLTYMSIGFIF